jgi:uridine phosphorylase
MDFFDSESEGLVNAKDLVRALTSHLGVRENDLLLPATAIVTFGPRVLTAMVSRAGGEKLVSWRGRTRWLYLADMSQRSVLIARSPYGAPGAVIFLEELFAFGVQKALFVGYCGAIQDDIGVGEIVLPTRAVREEGTSYHYLPPGEECEPEKTLVHQLDRWLRQRGISVRAGTIWTTDALYRETRQKIQKYRRQGVLGVDMETSALFAVGKARKGDVVALLLVSDRWSDDRWAPGFNDPFLLDREGLLVESILKWVEEEA